MVWKKRCSEKHAHSNLGLVHRFVMAFLSDCHWLDPAWHCSYFRKNRYFQSAKGTYTRTHAHTNIHVKLLARRSTNLVSVCYSILNIISFAIRWDILNRKLGFCRFCYILAARTHMHTAHSTHSARENIQTLSAREYIMYISNVGVNVYTF